MDRSWMSRHPLLAIQRPLARAAVALSFLLCSGCISHTTFQPWQGTKVYQGQGGAFYTKDGIDVYTDGEPDRAFRILGVVDNMMLGSGVALVLAGGTWASSAIVGEAKENGGDAVILGSSNQQIIGYSSSYSSAGGTGSGSGQTTSLARRKAIVVKYVDGPVASPHRGSPTDSHVQAAANPYAAQTKIQFALAAQEARATYPQDPFCWLHGHSTPNLIVLRLSERATRAGVRPGDKLLSIAGVDVYDHESLEAQLVSRVPGEVIAATFERSGRVIELDLTCEDGLPVVDELLAFLDAGAEGQWNRCLWHIAKYEQITVPSSVTARLQVTCNESKRFTENRAPSYSDAVLVHTGARMTLEEAELSPTGVGDVRGEVLVDLQWLEDAGYPTLAEDLSSLLDESVTGVAAGPP